MENYKDYEKKQKENEKRNRKFIKEFESWLNNKKLSPKTIRKHLQNIDLYLNYYLSYYEINKMEDGAYEAFTYLNSWYMRKCLFASKTGITESAASIKKFYKCMCELGYVSNEDYNYLCESINNNMDEFLESFIEYDNFEYDDFF